MLLPIHILAGALALMLGAVALLAPKGASWHRRSGRVFVYAMVTMGISGSILGFRRSSMDLNVVTGMMPAYFVITAMMTVRPDSTWTRRITAGALTYALALSVLLMMRGFTAMARPRGTIEGVPYLMLFFLATIFAMAAAGDVRVVRSGPLRGGARLARHLWRMCFALFIAAGSFFSIRERVARILPEPFTTAPIRALPVILVFGAMFYWLWRVRRNRARGFRYSLRSSA
jgi:hypothetical protein